MNCIYLVRHGENLANLTKEFSYRKVDYSLTEKGVLQARQTAAFFLDRDIHEVYSSPLKRARETADIIAEALHLPVTDVEDFREMNVGDLEGQPVSAALWTLHNEVIASWKRGAPEQRFPGGENYYDLLARVRTGLETVLRGKTNRNIVIACHGGMVSFTLKDLCIEPDPAILTDQIINNCSITELQGQMVGTQLELRLVSLGWHGHLSGAAAELISGLMDDDELRRKEG